MGVGLTKPKNRAAGTDVAGVVEAVIATDRRADPSNNDGHSGFQRSAR